MKARTFFALYLLALLLGCAGCRFLPVSAQRGGGASVTLAGFKTPAQTPSPAPQTAASVSQGENPAAPTAQTVERQETRQEAAPLPSVRVTETPTPAGIVRVTEQFGPPTVLTHTVSEKTGTTLGAAQRDTSRELAARLAGMRPIQFAGIALLIGALAMFHPVVRVAVGAGKEMQLAAGVVGLALVFGPPLVAGHEVLFGVAALAALALGWLSFRHSYLKGQLDTKTSSPPAGG